MTRKPPLTDGEWEALRWLWEIETDPYILAPKERLIDSHKVDAIIERGLAEYYRPYADSPVKAPHVKAMRVTRLTEEGRRLAMVDEVMES